MNIMSFIGFGLKGIIMNKVEQSKLGFYLIYNRAFQLINHRAQKKSFQRNFI